PGPVQSVAFSPDGRWLVAGCGDVQAVGAGMIALWRVPPGRGGKPEPPLWTARAHDRATHCVAFSRDGRWLASGGLDGSAALWDLASARPRAPVRRVKSSTGLAIHSVAFSPDGRMLATGAILSGAGAPGSTIELWQVPDGRRLGDLSGHT